MERSLWLTVVRERSLRLILGEISSLSWNNIRPELRCPVISRGQIGYMS